MANKLTFKKGDGVKYIEPGSGLIPRLLEDGWVQECVRAAKQEDDSIAELKAKAKELGIKGAHLMKKETLVQKIKEAEK